MTRLGFQPDWRLFVFKTITTCLTKQASISLSPFVSFRISGIFLLLRLKCKSCEVENGNLALSTSLLLAFNFFFSLRKLHAQSSFRLCNQIFCLVLLCGLGGFLFLFSFRELDVHNQYFQGVCLQIRYPGNWPLTAV